MRFARGEHASTVRRVQPVDAPVPPDNGPAVLCRCPAEGGPCIMSTRADSLASRRARGRPVRPAYAILIVGSVAVLVAAVGSAGVTASADTGHRAGSAAGAW